MNEPPLAALALDAEVLAAQARIRDAGLPPGDVLTQPLAEARARIGRYQAFLNAGGPAVAIEQHILPAAPAPAVPVRLYRPASRPGPLPVYLHVHGGGFATGDLDSLDRWKREVAGQAGIAVVGLDYALAPEHPYPTALEQVLAVLRWLRAGAAGPGIDPGRIAIGGDSAGGNLALAAMLRLRDAGEALPCCGILAYGMLSAAHDTPSHRQRGDGRFGLSTEKLAWFWARYLPAGAPPGDPYAQPLAAPLHGLPPLLLLAAALDPLLDDTLNLAHRLRQAGVPHETLLYDGMPHGFIGQTALLAKARVAQGDVVAALGRHLGLPPHAPGRGRPGG